MRGFSALARAKPASGLGWALLGGIFILVLIAGAALAAFAVSVPLPDSAPGGQATKVFDANAKLIGMLHAEQNRTIVDLAQISPDLRRAVVATEDRNFYKHSGVSLRGTVRALLTNVRSGGVEQGGSTITQQYARNAFATVGTERSFFRKAKEIALAVKIERKYPKQKILEFYLNTVYFGRGAYGAEAAARTYFKKAAKDLDLGESAYLAGVLRSPNQYQVDKRPEAAVAIRDEVLGDMVKAGYISDARAAEAKAANFVRGFKLGPTLRLDSAKAGFFLEHVRRLLLSREYGYSDAEVLGGGLQVTTTLHLEMQVAAENAISSTLNRADDPEAALIAMDPEGRVKAMVGGRDVSDPARARGFNFAANVGNRGGGRQAGSAFKPFALAAFVDEGKSTKSKFSGPRDITINSPRCRNRDGTPWKVSNFGNEGYGQIDMVEATANSVNTVYAQVMDKVVSPDKFIEIAKQAGVEIPREDKGCALTLGTSPVTPLEMARAFTTFAARGQRPEPLMITSIVAANGRTVRQDDPQSDQAISQNVADTVNYVLQEVVKRGTGTAAKVQRPAAGKTGTTQNHVDAWFAGYTPALTTVVWMGYAPDDSGEIPQMLDVHGTRVTGGSFPAQMWKKFMGEALKGLRSGDFVKPNLDGDALRLPCVAGVSPGTENVDCIPTPSPSPTPTLIEPSETPPDVEPPPITDFGPPPPPQPPPVAPRPVIRPTPSPSLSPSPSPTASPANQGPG